MLARFLRESGVDRVVTAPSKLVIAPGYKVKTDNRGARLLVEMLALAQVVEIRDLTWELEDLRDLWRLRATAAKNILPARQHMYAILLLHGVRYPEKTIWTRTHRKRLHRQRIAAEVLQFTFDIAVERAELLAGNL